MQMSEDEETSEDVIVDEGGHPHLRPHLNHRRRLFPLVSSLPWPFRQHVVFATWCVYSGTTPETHKGEQMMSRARDRLIYRLQILMDGGRC